MPQRRVLSVSICLALGISVCGCALGTREDGSRRWWQSPWANRAASEPLPEEYSPQAPPPRDVSAQSAQSADQGHVQQASATVATPTPQPPAAGSLAQDPTVEDSESSFWSSLSPKRLYDKGKALVGLGPDQELAKKLYAEGEEAYRQQDYDTAASRFSSAAGRWPDSALEEDALFMQGESYFFADRYPKASDTFANLLKKYQNSRYLDRVVQHQFALARYWEEAAKIKSGWYPNLTNKTRPFWDATGNAVAVYQSILENDPTGPIADDAVMAAANSYFLRDRWEDAAHYYDVLRKEFPKSEHQYQAHLLGMRSYLKSYQGPHYDGAPLEKADELISQMRTQFGSEHVAERERIEQAKAAVRAQQAERDWGMAEYYYKGQYYRAAAHYYVRVVQDYGDTMFGQMARERLEEIKNYPPDPPDRFWWLTNLFDPKK